MSAPASRLKKLTFVDPATFVPHFAWDTTPAKSSQTSFVRCEKVALSDIAGAHGTPTYVYSSSGISEAYDELDRGIGSAPHTLCFAVKSNCNLSILKNLAKMGSGFDVVSGGELQILKFIGVPGDRIVFSGVGKTREEICEALKYRPDSNGVPGSGILLFNIESEPELDALLEESARHVEQGGRVPAVSIRVNPDVQAGGHPHISTGHHQHKFGLDWGEARRLYRAHRNSKWINWQGISAHIGSQIVKSDPFQRALNRLVAYTKKLRKDGIALKYLDFGGGLGVRYTNEKTPSRENYARMVAKTAHALGMHLLLEPGRAIVGPAGVLLTRVLYVKQNRGKTFIVVDAAMNDLMRPALYGAVHPITRVTRDGKNHQSRRRVDIVGPVCETGDCFLRDWPLGEVAPGDLLAIWIAGAYGMSQASNYNSRCRPAEVLVEKNAFRLVRRRETLADLLQGQVTD